MELNVTQSALDRALRQLNRVVPAKATLPILQHLLVEATPRGVTLSASNLELGVSTSLPAEVLVPGRTAMPARLLADYVAELPSEPLHLAFDGKTRRVRAACGGFAATLATTEPDDFPAFPSAGTGGAVAFDRETLLRALARVAFAAAEDDSRPVLSAVLFDVGPTGLTLVASDSFRLGRARAACQAMAPRQALVPARAVQEFARLLADSQASAGLVLADDGQTAQLRCGDTTMVARLIEGTFPDVSRVIPTEARTRLTVGTEALRQAVRATGLFGRNGTARPVALAAEGGRLRAYSQGDETGEAEVTLPATVQGEDQAVALNARLLDRILEAAGTTVVELAWLSPQAPLVIREAGDPESDELWLVMPLHDPALIGRVQRPSDPAPALAAAA